MKKFIRVAAFQCRSIEGDVGGPGRSSDGRERPARQEAVDGEYYDVDTLPPPGEEYLTELCGLKLPGQSNLVLGVQMSGVFPRLRDEAILLTLTVRLNTVFPLAMLLFPQLNRLQQKTMKPKMRTPSKTRARTVADTVCGTEHIYYNPTNQAASLLHFTL